MPRDSNGVYTRTNGTFSGPTTWQSQANSADKTISSSRHDTHDQDLGDNITSSLDRQGRGAMQASLDHGGFRGTNMADGTQPTDAATVQQLGLVYLSTQTASASASLILGGLSADYDLYQIVLTNLLPATDGVELWLRVTQSATPQSGATDYEYSTVRMLSSSATGIEADGNSQGAPQMKFGTNLGNTAGLGANGIINVHAPASTANHHLWGNVTHFDNNATPNLRFSLTTGAFNANTTAIDGVQILMSTGNIASGSAALYGIRKA